MAAHFLTDGATITYVSDLEGNWNYWKQYIEISQVLSRDSSNQLQLRENSYFVHGGDVCDRGNGDARILIDLILLHRRYPDRVFFILGDRDVNKLRLPFTLHPNVLQYKPNAYWVGNNQIPADFPLNNVKEKLLWTLKATMGAPFAYECHRQELQEFAAPEVTPITDEEIIDSFVNLILPSHRDNLLLQYLKEGHMAVIIGDVLFVHGAVTSFQLGFVPPTYDRVSKKVKSVGPLIDDPYVWAEAINQFAKDEIADYEQRLDSYLEGLSKARSWEELRPLLWDSTGDYDSPQPGSRLVQCGMGAKADKSPNPGVIYASYLNNGKPVRIDATVADWLHRGRISKVIVGHQPNGDTPQIIDHLGVQTVSADSSYSKFLMWPMKDLAKATFVPDVKRQQLLEAASEEYVNIEKFQSTVLQQPPVASTAPADQANTRSVLAVNEVLVKIDKPVRINTRDSTNAAGDLAVQGFISLGAEYFSVHDPYVGKETPDGWLVKAANAKFPYDPTTLYYVLAQSEGFNFRSKLVERSEINAIFRDSPYSWIGASNRADLMLSNSAPEKVPSKELKIHAVEGKMSDAIVPKAIKHHTRGEPQQRETMGQFANSSEPKETKQINHVQTEALNRYEWNDFTLDKDNAFIGQGNFAYVFKGSWKNMNEKIVALKVVTPRICESKTLEYKSYKKILLDEGKILMQANHEGVSNIIRIYGFIEGILPESIFSEMQCPARRNEEAVSLVLEYIPLTLSSLIHTSPKVAWTILDQLHILKEIASGLADMHRVGIIHGDLKPQNVLITNQSPPSIKLIDFGLSKVRESLKNDEFGVSTIQSTANFKGSPVYSAPEMLKPQEGSETHISASRVTDMYSFAILSWEILTRRKPDSEFRGSEFLRRVSNGDRPNLSFLPEDCPPTIINMIQACWSEDRRLRKSPIECRSLLTFAYQIIEGGKFDVFFSHAWENKPFLAHVYDLLTKRGYRVWLDSHEMGHSLPGSINKGIENSQIVLVCLNSLYTTRPWCIYELVEAKRQNKTVLVLIIDPEVKNLKNEVVELCQLKDNRYVDFGEIAIREEWTQSFNNNQILPEELFQELIQKIDPLLMLMKRVGVNPKFVEKR